MRTQSQASLRLKSQTNIIGDKMKTQTAPSYRYDPQTKTLYKYSKEHKAYLFACNVPYTVKSAITAIRHYESREAMRNLKWG